MLPNHLPHGKGRAVNNNNHAGKGDSPRPVNFEVYQQNFDLIFRKNKIAPETENLQTISDDGSSDSSGNQKEPLPG